ncbi:hypothetical protein FQN54_007862 [Arachnomyces sp. PD_36]|nr:hypothetical protein FQN54_007862 [Arachnomyces sp. PD_36]
MAWYWDIFIGFEMHFPNATSWTAFETVQSKAMGRFREERVLLRCRQSRPPTGKEAIIKVHMQIPTEFDLSADERAKQATTSVSILTSTELKFLSHLTEKGCPSTPRLLSHFQVEQAEDFPVPGGYLVCLLMEKLPGKMIMDFWDYDRAKRDRIREAFKAGWQDMIDASVWHHDEGRRNLLWDEETNKWYVSTRTPIMTFDFDEFIKPSYILDFEDATFMDEPEAWTDSEFIFWELARKREGEVIL